VRKRNSEKERGNKHRKKKVTVRTKKDRKKEKRTDIVRKR
jgi:hypothetical protein